MAEIVREAGINTASCHALLKALTMSGYLLKLPKEGRYVMGPALVAAGQAAMKIHPLIDRAQQAAQELFDELGVPVMLATMAGDDILALSSHADRSGRTVGMKTGQRLPVVPSACLVFVAWSSEATIEKWLARAGVKDETDLDLWRQALALIRERGFQVTLLVTKEHPLSELMAEMARGHKIPEYKNKSLGLIGSSEQNLEQLAQIIPDEHYDVAMIAAPIFDEYETAPLSMVLGGFAEKLTGAEIEKLAEQLVRTCLRVMREHRSV